MPHDGIESSNAAAAVAAVAATAAIAAAVVARDVHLGRCYITSMPP